jgi:2,3-dihydroxybiphenyl 1,2-dioxygenase
VTSSGKGVQGLAYLLFEVSDLGAWDRFLTRVIGAERSPSVDSPLSWYRIDDLAARILLQKGPADDVIALGFEVDDEDALGVTAERVRQAGHRVDAASDGEAMARGVRKMVRTYEPGGVAIELVCEPARASERFHHEVVKSGFVTGDQGVGHIALRASDIAQTRAFFETILGFELSDRIECTLPGDFKVDITFLHVNPRHHTVALGSGLPKHLHHFMLQMASLDDVGAARDRAFGHDIEVPQDLGRHPNDKMITFYCVTPSGFQCEIGAGGRTVDQASWQPTTYDRISDWGHRSPYRKPPQQQSPTGEQL